MTFRVFLSSRARIELNAIVTWYGERSHEAGIRWYLKFFQQLVRLETDPHRWPLARESEELGIELHEFFYGSGRRKTHRVLFQIQGRVVEVVAIRHQAQRNLTSDDLGGPAA